MTRLWKAGLSVAFLSCFSTVWALGTSCVAPLGPGTAPTNAPFWLETIEHRGLSAFHENRDHYPVFRNVKSYGAVGDGVTDDSDAINQAIADGNRCGQGCDSSTITPALVYFPKGTYLVSRPIIAWYYTALVGDAKHLPTLLAAPGFNGMAVIDADPYIPGGGGAQWYQNQNNFFRSVRNFIIDLRHIPSSTKATGLHWQVSQATSLINVRVEMSTKKGNNHQGIFMENGSGGFMGDLLFRGGKYGIWVGNQQFTVRNLTVEGSETGYSLPGTGVNIVGWTFQDLKIKDCQIGVDITTGGTTQETQTVGAEVFLDVEVTNTPTFIRTSQSTRTSLGGSILIDNAKLRNVQRAVAEASGFVVLDGGDCTIAHWAQGNVYSGTTGDARYVQAHLPPPHKPRALLDSTGKVFGRTRPQYEDYAVDQFVSVKAHGAKGDGVTDDTHAIREVFRKYAGCKIIYFDAGTYMVSAKITIPAGTHVVGELWSVVMGQGAAFAHVHRPEPVVEVGAPCSQGVLEISDMVFSTRGPTPGAIVVQWNVGDPAGQQGAAGAWDTHVRLGSSYGTHLGSAECLKQRDTGSHCFAAFLGFHLTASSSAYLEGLWVWLGDHDLDGDHQQVTVYSGRGILSESAGPVWMVGTAEHHVLYQYNLVGARDHYIGLMQTETPYYQPSPAPPHPFRIEPRWQDPEMYGQQAAWGLAIAESTHILIYGAGLYSFFRDYTQTCLATRSCQAQILAVDAASRGVHVLSLSTVGTAFQLSVAGRGVVRAAGNRNGFAETATSWVGVPRRRVYTEPAVGGALPTVAVGPGAGVEVVVDL